MLAMDRIRIFEQVKTGSQIYMRSSLHLRTLERWYDWLWQRSWILWPSHSGKVHLGSGDARWFRNKGATSCRSVILLTGPTMGVLILVNYRPIWKCEHYGSPGSYSKTCGGSRGSDKNVGWYWSAYKWTDECILLNYTVSISNIFDIGYQIGNVPCWSWICRWWSHVIMMNMLVEGPWVMFRKSRPKEPVEAGWIDVAK